MRFLFRYLVKAALFILVELFLGRFLGACRCGDRFNGRMAQRFRTILTGRNQMDALRKSLSTVGKWAAQPAKGRKPKKAASGSSPAALGFAWSRRSRRALTSVGRVS